MIRKNKKGDIGDFAIFISVVFIIAITFFFGAMLWSNIVTPIQEKTTAMIDDPIVEAKLNNSMQQINNTFEALDWIWVIFFFGFYLALLISVFYLDTSPAFLIFALIGILILFIVGAILSDVWINVTGETNSRLAEQGKLNTFEFPIMNHIMSNLLVYLIIMSSVFLIILYGSKRGGG